MMHRAQSYLTKQRRQHMARLVAKAMAVAAESSAPPSVSWTIAVQSPPLGLGGNGLGEPSMTFFSGKPVRKKEVQAPELRVDE